MKVDKPVIILLGMSGAGKSTQAHLLSHAYGFTRVSVGEQLRELAMQGEVHIRQQIEDLVLKGFLMPDETVIPIMIDPIQAALHSATGFILDGTPRNLRQDELLKASLLEMKMRITSAIYLNISLDQVKQRVIQRLMCKNCQAPSGYPGNQSRCDFCGGILIPRMDDISDIMDKRRKEYLKQTEPLIQVYNHQGILTRINAEQPIHIVFAEIIDVLHLMNL